MNVLKYSKINFYEKRIEKPIDNITMSEKILFLSYEEHKATIFYKAECDEEYKKRFNKNDLCVALLSSEIVNVSWITNQSIFIDEIETELQNDGIIIYDVNTKPEKRGKGYYSKMLNLITNWAAMQGHNKITIYSEAKNKSSIKGIIKAEFKYTKSICMFKAFKYKFYI